jgi:hypothetical protein
MKALLIDPATRTITTIDIAKGIDAIYKAMDCEMFECPVEFPNGDTLYCDEEGKLNRKKLIGGFTYPKGWNDVVMNKALVIGTNPKTGESRDCKSKPEDILVTEWGQIKWFSKDECERLLDRMGF